MPSFRSGVLLALVITACGGPIDQTGLYEDLAGSSRVRIVAANLTTGNNQAWTPGEGLRILKGLHPDVVLVQEFNYNSNTTADFQGFANTVCGTTCYFTREQGSLQIPNGIVSRYPIRSSGRWADSTVSNRGFAWAQIDIPGPRDLWVVSVHLLSSSPANRATQGNEIVQYLAQAVPAGDYLALGGDFNTGVRDEPVIANLTGTFVTDAPWPADQAGNANTNASRAKPYDWVLVNPALQARQAGVTLGSSTFPSGAVVDTRVYSPIADVGPAVASDSAANNMQHMAVVRDFQVPADGATDGGSRDGGGARDGGSYDGGSYDGGSYDGGSYDGGAPDAGSAGDVYEPDDSSAFARPIYLGQTQTHDISPQSDQDWLAFTLTSTTNIRLETAGPAGGDTYVHLLNAAHRELAYDDDSGAGYYSLLRRAALSPGTYYVQITSYAGASIIHGYTVTLSSY